MITLPLSRLHRDSSGAAVIEFAFAMPVIITMMICMVQMGLLLHADGALRNAVSAGTRLAKVDPAATTTEIEDEVKANLSILKPTQIVKLAAKRDKVGNSEFARIDLSYKVKTDMILFPLPEVVLNESKQVWLPK